MSYRAISVGLIGCRNHAARLGKMVNVSALVRESVAYYPSVSKDGLRTTSDLDLLLKQDLRNSITR
jgi:hypothetical protein